MPRKGCTSSKRIHSLDSFRLAFTGRRGQFLQGAAVRIGRNFTDGTHPWRETMPTGKESPPDESLCPQLRQFVGEIQAVRYGRRASPSRYWPRAASSASVPNKRSSSTRRTAMRNVSVRPIFEHRDAIGLALNKLAEANSGSESTSPSRRHRPPGRARRRAVPRRSAGHRRREAIAHRAERFGPAAQSAQHRRHRGVRGLAARRAASGGVRHGASRRHAAARVLVRHSVRAVRTASHSPLRFPRHFPQIRGEPTSRP